MGEKKAKPYFGKIIDFGIRKLG